jgi:hypothetical protein
MLLIGRMNAFRGALAAFAGLWLLGSASLAEAQEGKRVALVIGNDAYSISPLKNAVNDPAPSKEPCRAPVSERFCWKTERKPI